MNLQPGTFLQGGKYRIDKVLAQGGFGITYLGLQSGLNRKVAVKEFFMRQYCDRDAGTTEMCVLSRGAVDEVNRFKQKFIREAQIIASLDNSHIVHIHDVFEENGTAYYVMEYVEGGSLEDYVHQHGALPEAEALQYVRAVAGALGYIRGRNVCHLDIKPGNILLRSNGEVVLIDFGLAKHYDETGRQTSITPVGISYGYAPLEQYQQGGMNTFSPASDIYSLGAVCFKLLTGNTPPRADEIMDEGLPAMPASISGATVQAVRRAMSPRRKDRPQTIADFLALLDDDLDAETVWSDEDNEEVTRPAVAKPVPNADEVEWVNGFPVRWDLSDYIDPARKKYVQSTIRNIIGGMTGKTEPLDLPPDFQSSCISREALWSEAPKILLDANYEIDRIHSCGLGGALLSPFEISQLLQRMQKCTGLPFRLPAPGEYGEYEAIEYGYCLMYNPWKVCYSAYGKKNDGLYCVRLACDKPFTRFVKENGKYVLEVRGKRLPSLQYDEVGFWNFGFATVRVSNRWGMVNKNGKEVVPPVYDELKPVSPFCSVPGPGVPPRFFGAMYRRGDKRGCFRVMPDWQVKVETEMSLEEWNKRELWS